MKTLLVSYWKFNNLAAASNGGVILLTAPIVFKGGIGFSASIGGVTLSTALKCPREGWNCVMLVHVKRSGRVWVLCTR